MNHSEREEGKAAGVPAHMDDIRKHTVKKVPIFLWTLCLCVMC